MSCALGGLAAFESAFLIRTMTSVDPDGASVGRLDATSNGSPDASLIRVNA
jgi:hypothetical protein